MEVLLIILSFVLIAGGLLFSILPPIPGPLLVYAAAWTAHYINNETSFSTTSLIIWGLLAGFITLMDNFLPIIATKKFGGTKAAIIGGSIGSVVGLLLPIPMGIIVGPLVGAIVGDLYAGNHFETAFKSGLGSLAGFLIAIVIKVIFSMVLGSIIVWKIGAFGISFL